MSEMGSLHRHHRLIPAPIQTPVGSVLLAGLHLFGFGVNSTGKLRSYDGAALILVTRGEGMYKDASRKKQKVQQGDAILVFPGNPHWYGPTKGKVWDEVYVAVDGPLFDAFFRTSLLNPANPIRSVGNRIDEKASWLLMWIEKFESIKDQKLQVQALVDLSGFICDVVMGSGLNASEQSSWLAKAQSLLGNDLRSDLDLKTVASAMNTSYEAFRKRFLNQAGVSPLRYRNERKVEAAKQLMKYSTHISNREIADALGFSDEFHFSKRFRQIAGVTPQSFRKGS